MKCYSVLVLPNGCKIWYPEGRCYCVDCQQRQIESEQGMNNELVKWHYIRAGDTLEYRDRNGIVKQIGPVVDVEWRPDKDRWEPPNKKHVRVPALREPDKLVAVPLQRVQAVFRNDIEVIRFSENEQESTKLFPCITCWQRPIDPTVKAGRFCSLHCLQAWIETYYKDYPGENPIDKGEYIHSANCGECRKTNRAYCPKCVD